MPSEWTSARVISRWDSPWKLIQLKFLIRPVSARNLNGMHAAQSWFPSSGEQGCSISNAPEGAATCWLRRIAMASRLYKIRKMRSICYRIQKLRCFRPVCKSGGSTGRVANVDHTCSPLQEAGVFSKTRSITEDHTATWQPCLLWSVELRKF